MASADGVVLPNPAIPKTLGILNVIFAVGLILVGLCLGGVILLAPALAQFGQRAVAQQQAQAEARKASELTALDDRAKAATTDEEKTAIAKERDAVTARPVPVVMTNMDMGTEVLKDPRVLGFSVAQLGTGLLLHIVLFVSGIGLIRLAPWGRTLGVWWAGLQIVQLLILGVISFMVILPIQQASSEATLAKLKEDMGKPNAPPNAAMTMQMAESMQTMTKFTPAIAVAQSLAGLTYPVICWVLLSTAGARAACLRRPAEGYPTGP